jgi:hypothetical protein
MIEFRKRFPKNWLLQKIWVAKVSSHVASACGMWHVNVACACGMGQAEQSISINRVGLKPSLVSSIAVDVFR